MDEQTKNTLELESLLHVLLDKLVKRTLERSEENNYDGGYTLEHQENLRL